MELQWRHFINLHKFLTPFVVLALIWHHEAFTSNAFLYLGMHGSYAFCWLLKDRWFADRNFAQPISFKSSLIRFMLMGFSYWTSPVLICKYHQVPSNWAITTSVSLFTFGMLYHYGSDCQKHFTLKLKRGLITEGFFSTTRNPNYLGEILIYLGLAGLAGSLVPFALLGMVFFFVFYPNMQRKDQSMTRHEGYEKYKARTNLLIPFIL